MKYASLKEKLIKKQHELEQRLADTGKHIRHESGPLDKDFAEQAVETENDDVIYALSASAKTEINNIKKALARIEQGKYDSCINCGGQISFKRLKAIPYTTLCIQCANDTK